MDEMIKIMKTAFPEEMKDSETYFKMCKEADEMGNDELANALFEMARDEYTHAEYICEFLKEHGQSIPDDQMKSWKSYKAEVEDMFR